MSGTCIAIGPFADVPAYYAGSLEALTYRDGTLFGKRKGDGAGVGGALLVDLQQDAEALPQTLLNKLRRPVYMLESIDAQGMDSQALLATLRASSIRTCRATHRAC